MAASRHAGCARRAAKTRKPSQIFGREQNGKEPFHHQKLTRPAGMKGRFAIKHDAENAGNDRHHQNLVEQNACARVGFEYDLIDFRPPPAVGQAIFRIWRAGYLRVHHQPHTTRAALRHCPIGPCTGRPSAEPDIMV